VSAATTPRLSVIIPTHNRRGYVVDTVDSLRVQSLPADHYEVIVVCDGDLDGTRAALANLATPFRLKVLVQPQSGAAAARNRGVSESSADLIIFLDDDILAVPELLAEHLSSHADHPERVVVGRLLPDPSVRPRGWTVWEQRNFDLRYELIASGLTPLDGRKLYSGNVSVGRAEFEAAGGFDVRYRRAEDIELGYRLERRGADIRFNPGAACVHRGVHSFAGWCRIQYTYGRCDVLMADVRGGVQPIPFGRWFRSRNLLNRVFCRLALDRQLVGKVLIAAWGTVGDLAQRARAVKVSRWSYSAIANLQYWQGVADELGGRDQLWSVIRVPEQGPRVPG
jgi:glycosyltransferase involved in cell wall biosynthesis